MSNHPKDTTWLELAGWMAFAIAMAGGGYWLTKLVLAIPHAIIG